MTLLRSLACAAGLLGPLCGPCGPADRGGDGSLTLDWTLQFGSAEADTSYGIAALGWGDAVVATVTEGALGGPHQGGRDVYVARLDRRGALVWETQLGGPAGDSPLGTAESDDLTGLAVGYGGRILFSGHTSGGLSGANRGRSDVLVGVAR